MRRQGGADACGAGERGEALEIAGGRWRRRWPIYIGGRGGPRLAPRPQLSISLPTIPMKRVLPVGPSEPARVTRRRATSVGTTAADGRRRAAHQQHLLRQQSQFCADAPAAAGPATGARPDDDAFTAPASAESLGAGPRRRERPALRARLPGPDDKESMLPVREQRALAEHGVTCASKLRAGYSPPRTLAPKPNPIPRPSRARARASNPPEPPPLP